MVLDEELVERKRRLLFRYLKERGIYSAFTRAIAKKFVYNKQKYNSLFKLVTRRDLLDHGINSSALGNLLNSCVLWAVTDEGTSFWMRENRALYYFEQHQGFINNKKVDLDVLEEYCNEVYPISDSISKMRNHAQDN